MMRYWFLLLPLLVLPLATACNDGGVSGPPALTGDTIPLPSGLRYITIRQGQGAPAIPGRSVSVHYTGYLAEDGKQFDTSFRENRGPLTFVLNASGPNAPIRGFNEGILGMNVGGRRRLFIPANLGYGEAGNPPNIPANADLIFDVELFSVSSR